MSDFIQNREITTLQLLRNRPLMEIESELETFSYDRKITLLLPALYSEFEGPAMPKIISHLSTIPYIHRIVLSLDQADRKQFESVRKQFDGFPCDVKIIWQDSPKVVETYRYLESQVFTSPARVKGAVSGLVSVTFWPSETAKLLLYMTVILSIMIACCRPV